MIDVKKLYFSYTDKPFVENVSFHVGKGEIFGFLGPSGAGKSTIQKVLTGLNTKYKGSVKVAGTEIRERTNRFYENIGVDFEFSTCYEKFTARQNLAYFASLYEKQLGYNVGAARNVGGMNVTELETDFCKMGIVWDRFMPEDTILVADMAHVAPVFQEVPGKGVLFVEDLAKTGASDRKQIYGQIGLDHGPAFLHGVITGLATTAAAAAMTGKAVTGKAVVD